MMKDMTAKRGRPPHDDILTPREWEVLSLIEQGFTNEQIAERLGITFGGAKFHVAEILSKLAVGSREDAVRVARSHRRAAFGLPLWWSSKWPALATAGAVVILGVVLVALAAGLNTREQGAGRLNAAEMQQLLADIEAGVAGRSLLVAQPLTTFHYESVLTRDPPYEPGDGPVRRVEVWHAAPDRWRTHYYSRSSDEVGAIIVRDGEAVLFFNLVQDTYASRALTQEEREIDFWRPAILGPVLPATIQEQFASGPDWTSWEVVSWEEVAGVGAYRVRHVCCYVGEYLQVIRTKEFWIDPHHMFLLRTEDSVSLQERVRHEITRVEYDLSLAADFFDLVPPAGAREVPASEWTPLID